MRKHVRLCQSLQYQTALAVLLDWLTGAFVITHAGLQTLRRELPSERSERHIGTADKRAYRRQRRGFVARVRPCSRHCWRCRADCPDWSPCWWAAAVAPSAASVGPCAERREPYTGPPTAGLPHTSTHHAAVSSNVPSQGNVRTILK